MRMRGGQFGAFDTVYFGGGTPSTLPVGAVEKILAWAGEGFEIQPDAEVTLEANPGDVDRASLEALKDAGINRLNIGVQSFDPAVLTFLGRRHALADAQAALEEARAAGFRNLGMDLIYAVPGQDVSSWIETLERAVAHRPEHLSCYELTVEPDTPLGRRFHAGAFSLPSEELQREFFMRTSEFLEDAGYLQYEVSNFSRDLSLASRHNQKYWDHSPYLGLGPGAHSFLGSRRWWNHRSLDRYVTALREGHAPVAGEEGLSEDQLGLEALCLGLRTKKGVDLEGFARRHGRDLLAEKGEAIRQLRERGLVRIEEGRLRPTRAGLAVADQLALL
jgi:oxygen-independent coproporphyrinogen-3 oxidase